MTWTVTDTAGNPTTCQQTVTVTDDEDPSIACSADVTAECTGPGGAVVAYADATASDNCDPNPAVSCVPASG
ncbi:MAG: hypothetical protein IIA73_12100, partial [Proteobacteria bacterium]|nr:hypothetical protein [Pseudomonadota bacterium]